VIALAPFVVEKLQQEAKCNLCNAITIDVKSLLIETKQRAFLEEIEVLEDAS
jgi:hypothetical protein